MSELSQVMSPSAVFRQRLGLGWELGLGMGLGLGLITNVFYQV